MLSQGKCNCLKNYSEGGEMTRDELVEKIKPKRTFSFFGSLDLDLYTRARDTWLSMGAQSDEPLTVLFDSMGGDTFYSMKLGEVIKLLPCETIGIVLEASSAACTLLNYLTTRLITPAGRIFVHGAQPTERYMAGIKNDEHWWKRMRLLKKQLDEDDAQIRRLLSERSGLTEERVKQLVKRGNNLNYSIGAEEARELKLVDAIIPPDYKLFVPPKAG